MVGGSEGKLWLAEVVLRGGWLFWEEPRFTGAVLSAAITFWAWARLCDVGGSATYTLWDESKVWAWGRHLGCAEALVCVGWLLNDAARSSGARVHAAFALRTPGSTHGACWGKLFCAQTLLHVGWLLEPAFTSCAAIRSAASQFVAQMAVREGPVAGICC